MRVSLLSLKVSFVLDLDMMACEFLSDDERQECEQRRIPVWRVLDLDVIFQDLDDIHELEAELEESRIVFECAFDLFMQTFTHAIRDDVLKAMLPYLKMIVVSLEDNFYTAPGQRISTGIYTAPGYEINQVYHDRDGTFRSAREDQVRAIVGVDYNESIPAPMYSISMVDSKPDESSLALLDRFLVSLLKSENDPHLPLGKEVTS